MFDIITRLLAAIANLTAAVWLLRLTQDQGTRTARRFLAAAFCGWATFYLVAVWQHGDAMQAISRGLSVWLAVAVISLIAQRRRIMERLGMR